MSQQRLSGLSSSAQHWQETHQKMR